ncbi:hypothetical protein GQ53DRAFT_166758 [Thozetella sp. PMI_491]|nr:hypothetical protein GQ53DRAFT_166758 [Thozetella sp. PMI_491]
MPSLSPNTAAFLGRFAPGTWQHWMVSHDISKARNTYENSMKLYEEHQKRVAAIRGVEEKKAHIRNMIETLKQIQKVLAKKGAKRFLELYPDQKNDDSRRGYRDSGEAKASGTYTFDFAFHSVTDVTEARKAAYIELFEAAWDGNLDKIRKLTLTSWDDKGQEAPLKMAVYDSSRNSPFSLAFFRGHYEAARAILDIVQAQYSPKGKEKARYRVQSGSGGSEDCYSDDNSDDDSDAPQIEREVINDRATIDNVGQVSMKVKSHTLPQEFFNWTCPEHRADGTLGKLKTPLALVIKNNDLKGLKMLLDIGEHFVAQKIDPDIDAAGFFTFPDNDFRLAIALGRTELLAETIRRTGAGLPLEELVKDSGVEIKEKPKYYQGLTVYGKKRQARPMPFRSHRSSLLTGHSQEGLG